MSTNSEVIEITEIVNPSKFFFVPLTKSKLLKEESNLAKVNLLSKVIEAGPSSPKVRKFAFF